MFSFRFDVLFRILVIFRWVQKLSRFTFAEATYIWWFICLHSTWAEITVVATQVTAWLLLILRTSRGWKQAREREERSWEGWSVLSTATYNYASTLMPLVTRVLGLYCPSLFLNVEIIQPTISPSSFFTMIYDYIDEIFVWKFNFK